MANKNGERSWTTTWIAVTLNHRVSSAIGVRPKLRPWKKHKDSRRHLGNGGTENAALDDYLSRKLGGRSRRPPSAPTLGSGSTTASPTAAVQAVPEHYHPYHSYYRQTLRKTNLGHDVVNPRQRPIPAAGQASSTGCLDADMAAARQNQTPTVPKLSQAPGLVANYLGKLVLVGKVDKIKNLEINGENEIAPDWTLLEGLWIQEEC
ncbi:hypothetical protein B0H13DRAFT_1862140 [Mycena leptocephala]|nr:hypothetical protein B0H13DRAFT_1862140 [Mycena leptocephala]